MSKNAIAIILCLLASVNTSFGQQWIKTDVSKTLSVEFPGQPQTNEKQGIIVKQLLTPSYAAVAQITPLGNEYNNPNDEQLDQLYNGVIDGMIASMNPIGEPKQESYTIDGRKVHKIAVKMDVGNGAEYLTHTILIALDGAVNSFTFVAFSEDTDTAIGERFLNSITIKK